MFTNAIGSGTAYSFGLMVAACQVPGAHVQQQPLHPHPDLPLTAEPAQPAVSPATPENRTLDRYL